MHGRESVAPPDTEWVQKTRQNDPLPRNVRVRMPEGPWRPINNRFRVRTAGVSAPLDAYHP
jgi:hypothetical protein